MPALGPGRYLGRIKSYNPRHGFGFIVCAEAHSQFKRDVFIHKALIGDLQVGQEVTFTVAPSKDGHPQARDIRKMDGSLPGPSPRGESDKGKSKGEGRRRRRAGKGKGGNKRTTDGKGNPDDGEDSSDDGS